MELKYYLRGLGLGIIITALIMGFSLSGKQPMTDAEIMARAKQLGMIEDTVLAADIDKEAAEKDVADEAADENNSMEMIVNEQQPTNEEDVSRVEEIKEQADAVGQNPEEEQTEKEEISETEISETEISEEVKKEETVKEEAKKEEAEKNETSNEEVQISEEVKDEAATTEETKVEETTVESAAPGTTTITISSGDGSYTVSRKLAEAGAVSSAETYDKFLCQNGYDKKIRTGTYVIPADASDEQMARIITGME